MHSSINKKTREYYLCLIGVLGEFASKKAYEHAPTAPATAGDELRLMMRDKLLRYHKHPDRTRTFRICDPAGFEAITRHDPRIGKHAELIVGKKGARYPGSKEYRLKKKREASLMLDMLNSGFIVDGASVSPQRKISVTADDMTSVENVIESAPEGVPVFMSGLLLRNRKLGVTPGRKEMSVSTGTLASDGGMYTTYCINTAKYRWFSSAEASSAYAAERLYESVKENGRRSDGRLRSIFYTDTVKVAADILETKGNVKRMNPTSIFKLTYIVPAEDKEFAMDVTKMLTIPDWRIKADKVLGLSPSGKRDGTTEDGRNIYNLLCCNMAKLREIEGEIRRGRCKLVIHEWQKGVFEELYAIEIDAIVLSPLHFRGLLAAVREM